MASSSEPAWLNILGEEDPPVLQTDNGPKEGDEESPPVAEIIEELEEPR